MRLSTLTFAATFSCMAVGGQAGVVASNVIRNQNITQTKWGATCRDLVIPVHVSRTSKRDYKTGDYDIDVMFSLVGREVLIEADYELSARFCEPSKDQKHAPEDVLQILVHGSTFNKHMWDFPYKPETYSWTRYMNLNGYSTLAVDLIGAGNSTLPDGLLEVQAEVFVQNMHEVVKQVKSSDLLGKTFKKIAFVGFSIGGIVANGLANRYPDDVDMLVMLGITWRKAYIYPVFLIEGQAPARRVDPEKWGDFDEFYQTQSTLPGRELACFWGDWEQGALETDFNTRDTDTLGTAVTFTFSLVTAPAHTGPVFLGIGDNDGTFCGASCGSAPYEIYDRFPLASDYDVKVYPRTGHALMYHSVAPEIHRNVRDFLRKHSSESKATDPQRLNLANQSPLGEGEL